jgi:hypothetical protein
MSNSANKKIVFYAPPEIISLIDKQSEATGASVSEICRRALKTLETAPTLGSEYRAPDAALVPTSPVAPRKAE